jgi:GNAT superfamily N-acetyltransferase
MKNGDYRLCAVNSPEEWKVYHDMRRIILWENRGKFGVYDENRPDEHSPDNHPFLLLFRGTPVGVVRVDIVRDAREAIIRRMAIDETEQRKGHGRNLVKLIERFALDNGCNVVTVGSAEDATVFYAKCGYMAATPGSRRMAKEMGENRCEPPPGN